MAKKQSTGNNGGQAVVTFIHLSADSPYEYEVHLRSDGRFDMDVLKQLFRRVRQGDGRVNISFEIPQPAPRKPLTPKPQRMRNA